MAGRTGNDRPRPLHLNRGATHRPGVGSDWSRTPYWGTIPLGELVQGDNQLTFTSTSGAYHIHNVAIRVYGMSAKPLRAGPGSDVTPPTGQLTQISAGGQNRNPDQGGVLNVDTDTVTLTASASGAQRVEFYASYDGKDLRPTRTGPAGRVATGTRRTPGRAA